MPVPWKRIILCLDGTWVNSDKGYNRPTLDQPNATLQVPSNVTRVYRALRNRDRDGTCQISYYQPGVGSTGGIADSIAGGVFGAGVSENMREAYSFVAANYEPGDEIILMGFSRGAFTARAVASMISEIGLLNSKGMEVFYPIFKDVQNMRNTNYKDKFPTVPFPNKPKSPDRGKEYRQRLEEGGFTRLNDPDGYHIKIRCVAVWDTALALDEDRASFSPAVWERPPKSRTDLRQVWFPGAHSNVGGGLPDQEIANITMAWMMDQLASIGVAFQSNTIDRIFDESVRFYYNCGQQSKPRPDSPERKRMTQWASASIYDEHRPVRPWALGEIVQPETGLYRLAGKTTRTPGMYHVVARDTGQATPYFLRDTNEKIHRSVRIRLALEGLGYDDLGPYKCRALLKKGPWSLRRIRYVVRSTRQTLNSYGELDEAIDEKEESGWGWMYDGPKEHAPPDTLLMEEELGPYENELLRLNKGEASEVEILLLVVRSIAKYSQIAGDDNTGGSSENSSGQAVF
ncbi:hypothetical protein N7509_009929 [Penicillium cosmopolitanum]|uniref:T6SS Phospholipase effector Tle1-like catalytic domain-containing protein n=1 Tax=Penicillium cosmopolitanum TaxID=1131564 RepID=A0A9W9VQD6_9EURO|nr:uncharacterized protein N7509_009929 [Penicillium cosmopolitanum]KAJ5387388.1 hypothetical protein N7509_009929 [Penicillium cosmopolitanum]